MQMDVSRISGKYAQAFLNVFFDQVSADLIKKLEKLETFLKENKLFFVYLRIPSIPMQLKQEALDKFAKLLELGDPFKRMLFLLLKQNRIDFLDDIVSKILTLYRCRKKIQLFKISTSHPLDEKEKERVIKFVKGLASGEVVCKFWVDAKLISGMRIQSDSFLWERSVAKQLRDVKRSIFKQVGLW
jgi:F-type H+-transporting ATPase subunit delta